MGYIRHHALVVTSWSGERLIAVHDAANLLARANPNLAGLVSPVMTSATNGHLSFFVAPDGSKEGWPLSDEGDALRAAIVAECERSRGEDGDAYVEWVEVQYGDDDGETIIVGHSDERRWRARRVKS